MFTLQRVEGRLFAPMAWTLSFAILGSLIYSITLVPLLATYLFNKNTTEHKNLLWNFIQKIYNLTVFYVLKVPKTIMFVAVLIVLGGMYAGTKIRN